jgi:molybdopterin converting factor small subunit
MDRSASVKVRVRFVSLIQRHTGVRRVDMELPAEPEKALKMVINRYRIPWAGDLERSCRIFINRQPVERLIKTGALLQEGDVISFIPILAGG